MERQQAAFKLYLTGMTHEQIAEVFKLRRNTITAWAAKGEWTRKKAEGRLMEETNQEMMLRLFNNQLKVHDKRLEEARTKGETYLIEKGEIDSLIKLYSGLKKKDFEWSELVKIIRLFLEFVLENDLQTAKKLAPIADMFIHDQRKKI